MLRTLLNNRKTYICGSMRCEGMNHRVLDSWVGWVEGWLWWPVGLSFTQAEGQNRDQSLSKGGESEWWRKINLN
jgi:hypothetical protein